MSENQKLWWNDAHLTVIPYCVQLQNGESTKLIITLMKSLLLSSKYSFVIHCSGYVSFLSVSSVSG